ncbi:helicase C-terminal domain protein [Parascardovia denticolens DSM 10105 = JCM 12538]|uniref:Helicase C-terminal domain protein n=1 Tax=Parascardovia denticolens DSM 10105 = JCM 12538 TaxID=864564 RepID=E6K2B3_PARDN|nr:DEAD/DEAH box helicase [Parascardovia denticolens]EFT82901.1 helicase C-terminal domain protein [Parascardovia denticolens DSM 10105 = JCM 12538]EQW43606.1 hypothetical protein HMPREF9017_01581 [Parascardovia denticolens F0305]BAR04621.1 putative DNA repair helicase [Parascardovia denticolens DSM 10105 = JCM 12538]
MSPDLSEEDDQSAFSSKLEDQMKLALTNGFIDTNRGSESSLSPRLIANREGYAFGDIIQDEISSSTDFEISVAFVTSEAIYKLRQSFIDFYSHYRQSQTVDPQHSHGLLITSTYNYFNSPQVFQELLKLKRDQHIDVRVWQGTPINDQSVLKLKLGRNYDVPYHPKGYAFTHSRGENREIIRTFFVGSSNLTSRALSTNQEWNLKVSSTDQGDLTRQIEDEFHRQMEESVPLDEDWISDYEREFEGYFRVRKEQEKVAEQELKNRPIEPNKMQKEALQNLARLRREGEQKALVISATGTGKTYLAALDVKAVHPRRLLYIAGRQEILKKSLDSFKRILGCQDEDLGLLSGEGKETQAQYLFATVQTMSKPNILHGFAPDAFDYILIDEAHHAQASTYRVIVDYFHPQFLLGMTATPERQDERNIFELFDHNVAYEIRLQKALEANMLAPFHYYGIAEYLDGGESEIQSTSPQTLGFELSQFVSRERVNYIIQKLQEYSPASVLARGLIFCSRIEEAQDLSQLFNQSYNLQAERLYRTVALSGKDSAEARLTAIDQLDHGELDYILTVDLFNEGIDIPSINQVVMLRSTQSSIVFTQQLGRGLRKAPGKSSLIVIDFIGNYANNYLIPLALYGNTGDADRARKNMRQRSLGLSSITFDEISKERVFESLDKVNLSDLGKLTSYYNDLRIQLNRVPMLMDFMSRDPSLPCTLASASLNGGGGRNYADFVISREKILARKLVKFHGENKENQSDSSNNARAGGSAVSRSSLNKGISFDPNSYSLTSYQRGLLKMVTSCLLRGLRPHELYAVALLAKVNLSSLPEFEWLQERIFDGGQGFDGNSDGEGSFGNEGDRREFKTLTVEQLAMCVSHDFASIYCDETNLRFSESALNVLDFSYFSQPNSQRFGNASFAERFASQEDGKINYRLSRLAAQALDDPIFRQFFDDSICCGLALCRQLFLGAIHEGRAIDRGFIYGEKYTIADVMRLCCWPVELIPQNVGGYRLSRETNTMPIFIKYENSQYADCFKDEQNIDYFSKNQRHLKSPEFQWLRDQHEGDFIPIFIMRKADAASKSYYYVGCVQKAQNMHEISHQNLSGKEVTLVESTLRLKRPVDSELFTHLTGKSLAEF